MLHPHQMRFSFSLGFMCPNLINHADFTVIGSLDPSFYPQSDSTGEHKHM